MSYADEYTDEKLNALEKRVNTVYAKAYKDTRAMASEYFKTLEGRYNREYTSMMASTNTFENFAKWYKKNRDATSNDAAIKAYWSKNQNTYTEASFKAWYKTQVTRGERYEKMAENMAKRMTGANEVAAAYVNDTTPSIYSLNRNYAAYQVNKIIPGASFEIYNEQAVKNLMMDKKNVTEFRTLRVNPVRDYAWNSDQIKTVLTSGIIRGLSIDHLADEFLTVMMRNRSAAIRNARTAVTSAQNAGRLDTMDAAEKQGIKVKKQWHSMEDARVRFTHALLNGQIRDKDKKFSNGLMFPGDSSGNPAEVYNCRCRMEYILTDYMTDKSVETYDAWDKLTPTEKKAEKDKYNAWMAEQEKNRLNRGKVETDYTFDFKVPEAETVAEVENVTVTEKTHEGTKTVTFEDISNNTTKLKTTMTDDDYDEYVKMVEQNADIANLYVKYADEINIIKNIPGAGAYKPLGNMIEYSYRDERYIKNGVNKYSTLSHEYGHFFDRKLTDGLQYTEVDKINEKCIIGSGKYGKTLDRKTSNCDAFLAAIRADKALYAKRVKEISAEVRNMDSTLGFQDFMDGAFGKAANMPWHHGDAYYNRFYNKKVVDLGNRDKLRDAYTELGIYTKNLTELKQEARIYDTASEAWANLTAAYTCGGEMLEMTKKYMPNSAEAFIKIIGGT